MTLRFRCHPFASLAILLAAAPADAQAPGQDSQAADPVVSTPAMTQRGGVMRLSPEERDAAIEAGAARASAGLDLRDLPDRRVHGELGVMVGTNGTRAAYGSTVVPLGDNGAAAFSFETGTTNYRWRPR